jgi:hypothetical protein
MELTTEQLEQIEFTRAMGVAQQEQQLAGDRRRTKLELLRTAKEVLVENSRNKAIDEREVTSEDIIIFAAAMETYIES